MSPPSVKQHLAALRVLFNWLVVRQVVSANPALFVKGPKFSRQIGIPPILEAAQMRELLNSIEGDTVEGPRDRAEIAVMAHTFARVSAVAALKRGEYTLARRANSTKSPLAGKRFCLGALPFETQRT
jgi:site-specific recombinase XerC